MVQTAGASGGFARKLGRLFMWLGVFTFVVGALAVGLVIYFATKTKPVPASTVLELRLDRKLESGPGSETFIDAIKPGKPTLAQTIFALDQGAKDTKVKGAIVYVGGEHGVATIQELRDAIARFRKAGKFAYAFAPSFGEMVGGSGPYYLATACDEIWMQPSGSVGITGLRAESPFVKDVLNNIGVHAVGEQRKAYKNAFNMFTQNAFTEAHKAATEALLADTLDQLTTDIAAARKLDAEKAKDVFARGPYLAQDALTEKLVDHIGYRDQLISAVKGRAGGTADLLYASAYLERSGTSDPSALPGEKIAVVYGVGTIMPGSGSLDPLSGSTSLGADAVAAALRAAARDKDVKAVILRVDSPGGSYVASDTIWRETIELKTAGKPLIVSMGNVAASGGYFIAMNADKIVAEPGTLTGSIGVYAFKLVTRDLWAKLGVTFGTVTTSPNAQFWSSLTDFSPEDRGRLNHWLDFVYDDFTGKVAQGRKLSAEVVEQVAQGRVWPGRKAKELGLVDALGGMETAVALAKEAAKLSSSAQVKLVTYPEKQSLLAQILDDEGDNSDAVSQAPAWNMTWLDRAAALVGTFDSLAGKRENVLQAPLPDVR
ncbi:MAG: signal peptide peptidase SppA [Deltaproteobacteria bacterium]|nr:signal peptide peptidase SppA [Deltaproteobacteria bacterium]